MQVLISFMKDGNGNYVVRYKTQSIVVLPNAFKRLTGANQQTVAGSMYVEYSNLPLIGFIQEPVVTIMHEKNVDEMTVDELWKVLDREGIQIHSA
ncbi:hypothetical protein [Paenibacillus sp. SI8]|uniref:hypothetical protein n=1 Tax=unclassified Paenibacillus TaxID=185978 RepID=UPI003467992B